MSYGLIYIYEKESVHTDVYIYMYIHSYAQILFHRVLRICFEAILLTMILCVFPSTAVCYLSCMVRVSECVMCLLVFVQVKAPC